MATRDLTPQDEGNKDYVPNEDGAGVRGQSGDPAVDNPENSAATAPKDKDSDEE